MHYTQPLSPFKDVLGTLGGWGWNAVVSLCQPMHLLLWYGCSTNHSPSGVSLLWVLLFLKSFWAGTSHFLSGIFWLALTGWGPGLFTSISKSAGNSCEAAPAHGSLAALLQKPCSIQTCCPCYHSQTQMEFAVGLFVCVSQLEIANHPLNHLPQQAKLRF